MLKYYSSVTRKLYDDIQSAIDAEYGCKRENALLEHAIDDLDQLRHSYISELNILRDKYESDIADCLSRIKQMQS